MATYGSLYKLSYIDWYGDTTNIYIKKISYAGAETEILGGPEPLRLSINANSDDKFQNVRGTSAEIEIIAQTDFQFLDLYSSDARQYMLQIDKGGSTYWKGWLLTDQHQEPYIQPPYHVTLRASDGLGTLKNFDLSDDLGQTITGIVSERYLIDKILAKINVDLNLNLYENINIYEDNMGSTAADSVLQQSYIDAGAFYDDEGSAMSCYDVLAHILQPYNAYITQCRGAWHIIRVPVNKTSHTRRLFTWNNTTKINTYTSNAAYNPSVSTTGPDEAKGSLVRLIGNTLEVMPGWKEFRIDQKYGLKDSVIDFVELVSGAAGIPDWRLFNSPTVDYVPWSGTTNQNVVWGVMDKYYSGVITRAEAISKLQKINSSVDWALRITGYHANTTGASYIEHTGIDVTATTDDLLITFEFRCPGASVDIYMMLYVDAVTPQYLQEDGTWTTTPSWLYWDNPGKNTNATAELKSGGIPIDGVLKIRLYEGITGSTTTVMYHNLRLQIMPNDDIPSENIILDVSVNSNNAFIPDIFSVIPGDAPSHELNELMYRNCLYYFGGSPPAPIPTTSWTDQETTSETLAQCMAANMAVESNTQYEKISCKIISKLIDFLSIIDEVNHSNYKYFINRGTLHDKHGYWDVDLLQFAETYELLTESGEEILTEDSEEILTE